jgi:sestrin
LDDDYNYAEVNQLLNRQMKFYIKKITSFPQTVTLTDFVDLSFDLQPSEKCHIALLATEASKEASISYALKALSLYLKKKDR